MHTASMIVLTTGTDDRLPYLDKLIRSISIQTTKPRELVVASETSSDKLIELFGKHFNRAENHRIIATGCWNKCKTANRTIRRSRGSIVFLLEDDLVLEEGFVEQILGTFDLDPLIGSVYSRCIWVYPEGANSAKGLKGLLARLVSRLSLHKSLLPRKVKKLGNRLYEVPVFTMSVACRREALYSAGLYDENIAEPISGEDYDLALRIGRAGYRIVLNTDAVSYHFTRQVHRRSLKLAKDPKYLMGLNESEVYFMTKNREVLGVYVLPHAIYRILESVAWAIRTKSVKAPVYGISGALKGLARGLRSS